jgi:Collagen triple helix repeat (20 copies)
MFSTLRKSARHPVRAITEPFGKAGLVVAIFALILALTGAAWAAVGLNAKQKKEVKAIAKGLVGTGPAGAQGAAGPQGAPGVNGAAGPQGPTGPTGEKGANGLKGSTGATGPTGSTGATGPEGSPWTAGGTLPSGQTETGTWSMSEHAPSGGNALASISFPIPLSAAGESFFFGKEETEEEEFGASGCSGTVTEPTAPSGVLCIYTGYETNLEHVSISRNTFTPSLELGYGPSGAILDTGLEGEVSEELVKKMANVEAFGSWAVTAP